MTDDRRRSSLFEEEIRDFRHDQHELGTLRALRWRQSSGWLVRQRVHSAVAGGDCLEAGLAACSASS